MRHKVLFVCTANICRSPTAEGVARGLAQQVGVEHLFAFASAGTHGTMPAPPPIRAPSPPRRGAAMIWRPCARGG